MAKKKRTIYEVAPDGDDWVVKRQGAKRATRRLDTKDPAVDLGRRLAKETGHGQLIIKKRDGTIQEERTYGDDPYPPTG